MLNNKGEETHHEPFRPAVRLKYGRGWRSWGGPAALSGGCPVLRGVLHFHRFFWRNDGGNSRFTEDQTLADVQRQLTDRFQGADVKIVVAPPRSRETTCTASVAYGVVPRGRGFAFHIAGRSSTEVTTDLYKQILDWMLTAGNL